MKSGGVGAFGAFVRRRAFGRHWRRLSWWGHPVGGASHRHARQRVGDPALVAARLDDAALYARWHSGPDGLAEEHAQRLRRSYGANQVEPERALSTPEHLWQAFRSPFSLLLVVLAAVSAVTGDTRSAVVIGAMVILSTGLRFVQERRSSHAADALKALVSNRASVQRPGAMPAEVPMASLVPGDVVHLAAGDMVPADCRLLAAKDLFVNQSAMTGEAMPVEKHGGARTPAAGADALALDNLVFLGTNVVSGSARALVVATGARTFFGELAEHAAGAERAPTAFETGVNRVSGLLIRVMLVLVPLVLLLNGFGKGDWLQAALFAISVAVGLTPEMLPMIVTSTLARGAVALARRRVIVKRLDAVQNLGAMDVLATDKTGTLTQDRVVLRRHLDANGAESEEVLRWAYLNSRFQTGLANLLDKAVLEHEPLPEEAARWLLRDEIPFDFERRRLSVVIAPRDRPDAPLLVCKGAVDEVLAQCTRLRDGDADVALDAAWLDRLRRRVEALNDDGMRVIAVAVKPLDPAATAWHAGDECELVLVGFVAFLDPPKETSAPALLALAGHGVAVKVLTGDSERVTLQVCREVGLAVRGVLLGPAVDALDDAALARAVEANTVFAKLAPRHKERIVGALRANGHVVGFLGDGINDAPALHAADIGISVDSAVDVAKEVADLILLEKSLLVLDEGVVEGRRTFVNMLNYIRMAASSNFGNVLSVLAASALLPFLPMLPMHLLVQNLLYDLSQAPIPFDRVDDDLLAKPLAWRPAEIGRFMLAFGPVSSVFDLATFGVLWFGFGAQTQAQQTLFQSGWFVEGLITQVLVVHLIRTPRLPFVASRAAPALLAGSAAVVAFGLWLPGGPLAPWLRLQPLPPAYLATLPLLLLGYALCVQAMKRAWTRRWAWL